jgi:hypothetical protein
VSHTKIIGKIARLLKLAEGKGTTPAEAATAAAQAQRLMLKHNIEQAAVEGADVEPSESIERGTMWSGGKVVVWKMSLANSVARMNSCRVLIHSGGYGGASLSLIGRPSDAAIVRYLFAYLTREIDRLASTARPDPWSSVGVRAYRNAFRRGAVETVVARMRADRRKDRQAVVDAGTHCSALAVVDKRDAEVQAHLEKYSRRTYKAGRVSSASGLRDGRDAGRRLALRSGLGEGGARASLGRGRK